MYVSAFGTFENATMDYWLDNNLRGASYRVVKFTAFAGTDSLLGE